ncbi:hypothetical protein WA026_013153 [Henosepilachna vigintioctopunctata]|uniref:DUF4797 domain-containing protein n=1 Tax=Henosepilachna vigintioctopunctata TaxID=420089 RepID=A0AAW1UB20_9CUCU
MPSLDHGVMLTTLSVGSDESRSVSPIAPYLKEIRGIRLFRAISRKLGKRSAENLNSYEEDCRSSSTDSCSSTSVAGRCSRKQDTDSGFRSSSPNHISSSSSETGSYIQSNKRRHHHSTSAESIRKVFQNFGLNTRSHSCTNTKEVKRKTVKKSPKKILRSPVAYTYVKGLSGLPTQRIPKNQLSIYNSCNCNMYYMGLNR